MKTVNGCLMVVLGVMWLCGCSSMSNDVVKSDTDWLVKIPKPAESVVAAKVAATAPETMEWQDSTTPPVVTQLPKPSVNVTPMTSFTDKDSEGAGQGQRFSNTYTRLVIKSNDIASGGEAENLTYSSRNPVIRYLVGKKFDLSLSAKVKIGSYETTAPLLTIAHQSNSDGEQWSRIVNHNLKNYPLFLVSEDGESNVPEVRFALVGSKEYASNMSGTALQVAVAGIQMVSPEATVLTKLTAQSSKDAARAIDDVIGKLFASGVKEEHVTHRDLRNWNEDGGASIKVHIPMNEKDWDTELGYLGEWIITFDDPRPSIFSDWRICRENNDNKRCRKLKADALKEVHKEFREGRALEGQVLNFTLVKSGNGLGTIKSYLQHQDWYVAALSSFRGKLEDDKKTADNLCRNVITAITELGLNGDDAQIVVWAFINGLPHASQMAPNTYESADACKLALYAVAQE